MPITTELPPRTNDIETLEQLKREPVITYIIPQIDNILQTVSSNSRIKDWFLPTDSNTFYMNSSGLNKIKEKQALLMFKQRYVPHDLIEEAMTYIGEFFPNATIKEELHTDPEENWTNLFISICTPLSPKNASKKARLMFKNWTLATNAVFNKYISIGVRSL